MQRKFAQEPRSLYKTCWGKKLVHSEITAIQQERHRTRTEDTAKTTASSAREDNDNLASMVIGLAIMLWQLIFVYWENLIRALAIYIFLHWKIHLFSEKKHLCTKKICLCTGKPICALKHFCALKSIFVHWKTYLCTEKHIWALKNIFVHWKIYLCTGKHICAMHSIFVH